MLAEGLAAIPGVEIDAARVETNIVIFAVPDAAGLAAGLEEAGVEASRLDSRRVRMVTHLDVDRAGVERALAAVRDTLGRP